MGSRFLGKQQQARLASGMPARTRALPLARPAATRMIWAAATRSSGIGRPAGAEQRYRLDASTPALRSLALNTIRVPREQLQERYGPAPESPISLEVLSLVGLCTAVAFICSIDRAAMSVAILPISDQFGWDDSYKGAVSSAFFAGYWLTNLAGGFLATRFSAKGVLAAGVVLWSLFTIGTPAAAAGGNLGELMAARGVMGMGEGVTYPAVQTLVRRWVPEDKRSRALAFIYSGHQLGTVSSYLLAPLLIAHFGWPMVFWAFGSLGFVWLAGWVPLVSDAPAAQQPPAAAAAAAAAARISSGAAASSSSSSNVAASVAVAAPQAAPPPLRVQDVPWAQFAANPAFWAIVSAQVSVGVGNCLSYSWLPTFYHEVYDVDITTSSVYTVIPFAVTILATNAGGWIADGLVNNKVMSKTQTRKVMQSVASLGPAVCLLKLAADRNAGGESVTDALAMVTAWLALSGFSAAGYGSNHQDISRKWSGVLFGLSNGLASIAGSLSIYATGQVLNETHDWGLIFEAAAAVYCLGAVAYLKYASSSEQFDA